MEMARGAPRGCWRIPRACRSHSPRESGDSSVVSYYSLTLHHAPIWATPLFLLEKLGGVAVTAARRELVVISVRRRVPPSDRGRVGRFHDLHAIGGLVHAVRGRNVDTARVARAVGAVPNVRLRVAHRVRERVVKAARHAESRNLDWSALCFELGYEIFDLPESGIPTVGHESRTRRRRSAPLSCGPTARKPSRPCLDMSGAPAVRTASLSARQPTLDRRRGAF